ncbi:hypothetical protein AVEN_161054-1 [Araneus ventricosus]|uniref:Uncharacterized protein n=1 Tax=Araneus ventricosus TaxID=182803 RepID=A0A4Y2DZE9_ARAVE|nr:hypothetical protein AVEN_161054-1 [Araneus ventricosus]
MVSPLYTMVAHHCTQWWIITVHNGSSSLYTIVVHHCTQWWFITVHDVPRSSEGLFKNNEKFLTYGWNGTDGPILPFCTSSGNIVHSEEITNTSHLKHRIITTKDTVTPEMLHKAWRKIIFLTNGRMARPETY